MEDSKHLELQILYFKWDLDMNGIKAKPSPLSEIEIFTPKF